MNARRILRSTLWAKENIQTQARITRSWDGGAMAPSDCTSWGLRVYDVDSSSPSTAVYVVAGASPSLVLTGTYRTWDEDSTGYNFSHTLTETDWTRKSGHTYRAEYSLSCVSDGPQGIVHFVTLQPFWNV